MPGAFEQPPIEKRGSAEKMTEIGQVAFGFDNRLTPIIKWLDTENPKLENGDVIILKFPGQDKEVLRLTIGHLKDISQPSKIEGFCKTLPLDLSAGEGKKKFIFDAYKAE